MGWGEPWKGEPKRKSLGDIYYKLKTNKVIALPHKITPQLCSRAIPSSLKSYLISIKRNPWTVDTNVHTVHTCLLWFCWNSNGTGLLNCLTFVHVIHIKYVQNIRQLFETSGADQKNPQGLIKIHENTHFWSEETTKDQFSEGKLVWLIPI